MSKNTTITEGKQGRTFGGVERLETEQPDGNSCFWVPEDERRRDTKYVIENGDYYPDNYAMSEINVNVFDLITDLDGFDWGVTIDGLDIPHIDWPDLDIGLSIDDMTGDIDIHIGGKDPDDWPGWDDFDPDVKGNFDDWMGGGKDPDDWPGWDDFDPDVKGDFDDWTGDIDKPLDPEDFGLDPEQATDFSIDPENMSAEFSGQGLDGLDVAVSVDLGTLDIDTYELPDEIRIMHVPDKTAYKDGEEIDLEGIVVRAYRNGGVWEGKDGKYRQGYIPVHELSAVCNYSFPPHYFDNINRVWTKENHIVLESEFIGIYYVYEYHFTTGERKGTFTLERKQKITIDTSGIDGLIVLGNKDPWTNRGIDIIFVEKSKDSGEKNVNIQIKIESASKSGAPPEYLSYHAFSEWNHEFSGEFTYDSGAVHIGNIGHIYGTQVSIDSQSYHFAIFHSAGEMSYIIPHDIEGKIYDPPDFNSTWVVPQGSDNKIYIRQRKYKSKANVPVDFPDDGVSIDPYDIVRSYYVGGLSDPKKKCTVSWPRPKDNKLLTTSFDITVEESKADTGTHHSGTWGDDESGHWGGTTISGNYGGSHHSGKF